MKKISVSILLFVATMTLMAQEISLQDVIRGRYRQVGVSGMTPLEDGESFSRIEGGKIIRCSFKTGEPTGVVLDLAEAQGEKPRSIYDYIMAPDARHMLIETNRQAIYRRSATSDYYLYNADTKQIQPLSKNGSQECPLFSPDSKKVGFVRDNNLFIVDVATMEETQVTTDGKFNFIINGKPDWVYEEEFEYNRAFDFSADSKVLAWVRFDETNVRTFSFPWYQGMAPAMTEYAVYTGNYEYKYPKAGEENSKVQLLAYDIDTKATRTLSVPLDEDGYIPRIQFTYDKDRLGVITLNRLQNCLKIYMVNPHNGDVKLLMTENGNKYIETDLYKNLDFSRDKFIVLSDRDGFMHMYLYSTVTGELIRQLEKGDYDVDTYYGQDEKGKYFYYSSHEQSPLEINVYRVDMKGKKTILTPDKGCNDATFSNGCKYFLNQYSSMEQPSVYTLYASDGTLLKVLETNQRLKDAYASLNIAKPELFHFTTSEGVELNGWMVKPADFDPSKKYPVLMYQYSGPGDQQVMNHWGNGHFGGLIWEHHLAQKGYIVTCVDGRGTGGRGADWKKCTYLHLGDKESKDQVEAAMYLGSLPYIDKDRIAIWGWSYGGWNTLMSMSEGRPVFNCGIAVAPVTSYRFYDSAYTERYMGLPKDNVEGYADCPIARASKLHGRVLLCHGYADDNVHFQNMAELTEAYVQLGIQFESQFYVNRNHGISGGNTRMHLFTRMENFLDENLKK